MIKKIVSAEDAQELIEGPSPAYGSFEEIDRLSYYTLATIIAQSEQIQRLQGALHKADGWGVDVITNLIESEYITEEDMQ